MFPFILYPFLLNLVVDGFDRNDVGFIFVSSFVLIFYFYFLYQKIDTFKNHFWIFFLYSVILRCFVLGSTPQFSDDVYRYFFDANVLSLGFSPYETSPFDLIVANSQFGENLQDYLKKMNSPHYLSVYPVFLLLHFYLGLILNSLLDTSFFGVQVLFLLFDILNLYLIRKMYPQEPLGFYWIYYANPMVIIEGVSQMHPEILMIPWLLFLLRSNSIWRQGSFLLIGSQIKINFLLFMMGITPKKKNIPVIVFFVFLSFVIWKWTVFTNLEIQGSRGIGLFFHSFRFAGILEPFIYYPLSLIGFSYLSGFLSLVVFGLVFIYLLLQQSFFHLSITQRLFVVYFLFLIFSPVIHPWYWIPLVILGLLNRLSLKWHTFVLLVSFLSYFIYVSDLFFYIYWIVCIFGFGIYGIQEINYLRKTA